MRPLLPRRGSAVFGVAFALLLLPGCNSKPTPTTGTKPAAPTGGASALFENVASRVGIKFTHDSGAAGKFHFIENTAGGCAFFDYDNDGWLDIFLVQSGSSEPFATVKNRPHCALYHNKGDGTFEDVTSGSGLDKDLGHGQGAMVGDFDNDGNADLLVTGYDRLHLFRNTGARNQGNGAKPTPNPQSPIFEEVTAQWGLGAARGYATSAAFGDYDNDGKLDLYVCYYVPWSWKSNVPCKDMFGLEYCSPEIYNPATHSLYHNEGSRFVDVSEKAGIRKERGRGLSVAFVDYNNDGKQDIFVANDLTANMLWRNNGDKTFTDVAVQAGCAYDWEGARMAGMGIGVADYNHSGQESLFVGNFSDMPNMLYKNVGDGHFQDASSESGLALPHMKFLTFGVEFMDYDADGWMDLFVVNGHVQAHADRKLEQITYKERKQLFHNAGNGAFTEITDPGQLGGLSNPTVGRGMAAGDYDNDGRLDVLVNSQNDPAELFRNRDASGNHWVSFLTIGVKSNREGRHTRFYVEAGGMKQMGTARAGSSYLSHSDRRVYFGLGSAAKLEKVEIRWPSGTKETLNEVAADAIYIVTEGKGITGKLPNSGIRD